MGVKPLACLWAPARACIGLYRACGVGAKVDSERCAQASHATTPSPSLTPTPISTPPPTTTTTPHTRSHLSPGPLPSTFVAQVHVAARLQPRACWSTTPYVAIRSTCRPHRVVRQNKAAWPLRDCDAVAKRSQRDSDEINHIFDRMRAKRSSSERSSLGVGRLRDTHVSLIKWRQLMLSQIEVPPHEPQPSEKVCLSPFHRLPELEAACGEDGVGGRGDESGGEDEDEGGGEDGGAGKVRQGACSSLTSMCQGSG